MLAYLLMWTNNLIHKATGKPSKPQPTLICLLTLSLSQLCIKQCLCLFWGFLSLRRVYVRLCIGARRELLMQDTWK